MSLANEYQRLYVENQQLRLEIQVLRDTEAIKSLTSDIEALEAVIYEQKKTIDKLERECLELAHQNANNLEKYMILKQKLKESYTTF